MTTNFYDKVAKKFGGYAYGKSHVKHLTEYPNGDPEKIFKKKLIGLANKNKIALMKKDIAGKSLIGYCKTAVSLEYGKDNSRATYKNTFSSIISFLEKEKMIDAKNKKREQRKIDFYEIKGVAKKEKNDVLKKNIKNFKLIKKGEIFAIRNNKGMVSKENFYPILFGEEAYGDIFGFKATKE